MPWSSAGAPTTICFGMKDMMFCENDNIPDGYDLFDLRSIPESDFVPIEISFDELNPARVDTTNVNERNETLYRPRHASILSGSIARCLD